tara:strand:+ start:24 stop:1823 length:1800 start_codon:yes stop_codon:yes gene_type:complete
MKNFFFKKILLLLPKKLYLNVFLIFILNLFGNILEVFGIGMLPILVLNILNPSYLETFVSQYNLTLLQNLINRENSIVFLFSIVALFYLFKNLYLISIIYFQRKLGIQIVNHNRKLVFKNYLFCDYQTYINKNPSTLIALLNNEIPQSCALIELSLLIARELLLLIFITITIFFISAYATIITLFVLALFLLIYYLFIFEISKKRGKISLTSRVKNIKVVNESFDVIKEIKIYNKAKYFFNLFSDHIKLMEKQKLFNTVYSSIPKMALEICLLLIIIIIVLINKFIFLNSIDLIPIITFIGASSIRIIPAFKLLASSINQFSFSSSSLDIVTDELKNLTQKIKIDTLNKKKLDNLNYKEEAKINFEESLKFKNVNFSYLNNKNHKIISEMSFEIKKGEKIGIVGPSGSGKSTILNLITGLLNPTEGSILVDNKEIVNKFQAWSKNIGYVPQDVNLFNTTLKNNIAFGVEDSFVDIKNINKTIQVAQLDNFLKENNNDLNFLINTKSMNISGGQKQRIGIARAIYNNPKILIFDEATNSLDFENEKKIISTLFSNKEITIFIVAHRVISLDKCDKLIYIVNGKLIEIGTFKLISEKYKLI